MWRDANSVDPVYTDTLELDLSSVVPSLAGPKRPQDRVPMTGLRKAVDAELELQGRGSAAATRTPVPAQATISATATS